jgi:hypothetical protein
MSGVASSATFMGNDLKHWVQVITMNGSPLASCPFRGIHTGAVSRRWSGVRSPDVLSKSSTIFSSGMALGLPLG